MPEKILFPNEHIINAKYFEAHQDWEVPIPGFFILATKGKVRSVSDFTEEEAIEFMHILQKVRKGMHDILGIKDVYLFQNEDTTHDFHIWLFPRYAWMEKFGRKIQSVRPILEYAKENMATEEMIREVKEHVKKMKKYMTMF